MAVRFSYGAGGVICFWISCDKETALPQSSPFSKNENGEDACMVGIFSLCRARQSDTERRGKRVQHEVHEGKTALPRSSPFSKNENGEDACMLGGISDKDTREITGLTSSLPIS
jgi:hypothetical protein